MAEDTTTSAVALLVSTPSKDPDRKPPEAAVSPETSVLMSAPANSPVPPAFTIKVAPLETEMLPAVQLEVVPA